jgi:hypothetical protein
MNAAIDNDVLLKGACYGLLEDLIWSGSSKDVVGVLGTARFVVPARINKAKLNRDRAFALRAFSTFLARAVVLEPSTEEQEFAADLELAAQGAGANLDVGESQLCAIVVNRLLPLLVTGDKRAIVAIEALLDADTRLAGICGRVKCFEQVVVESVAQKGCSDFRLAVCAEPSVDKALSICFSCKTQIDSDAIVLEGLQSYIQDLRRRAGRSLVH